MSDSQGKRFILGVYDDEETLMEGIDPVKKAGVKIHEVFSPYPLHHVDEKLGYKPSRLPVAAFLFGATGTACALLMQFGMLAWDWPMNVGGKPHGPLPDFIPITFELTVLLASWGMGITFLVASKILPGSKPVIFDKRITDDKFVVAIEVDRNKKFSDEELKKILNENGAIEVNEKEV